MPQGTVADIYKTQHFSFEEAVFEVMESRTSSVSTSQFSPSGRKVECIKTRADAAKKLEAKANTFFKIKVALVVAAVAFAIFSVISSILFSPITILLVIGLIVVSGKSKEIAQRAKVALNSLKAQIGKYQKDNFAEKLKADFERGAVIAKTGALIAKAKFGHICEFAKEYFDKAPPLDEEQMNKKPVQPVYRFRALFRKYKTQIQKLGRLETIKEVQILQAAGKILESEAKRMEETLKLAETTNKEILALSNEIISCQGQIKQNSDDIELWRNNTSQDPDKKLPNKNKELSTCFAQSKAASEKLETLEKQYASVNRASLEEASKIINITFPITVEDSGKKDINAMFKEGNLAIIGQAKAKKLAPKELKAYAASVERNKVNL